MLPSCLKLTGFSLIRSSVGVAPAGMRNRDLRVPQHIGVAFIDTPDGHAALDLAVRLAARVGASLTLYSVLADEAEVVKGLRDRHVLVRAGASLGREAALRVTVGTEAENERLVAALGELLA